VAISIDWSTKVISVPLADLSIVSAGVYELDIETFRLALKDVEDSEEGMGFPDTHRRNAPVTLSGTSYAQTFEILAPYTVTFENGSYRVRVVGGNHNIADRMIANSVSIEIGNSAGLIEVATGGSSGPTAGEIAAAVLAAMNATPPGVDVKRMNGAGVIGDGTEGDPWRGVGVPP
jgi:hypothetical protein